MSLARNKMLEPRWAVMPSHAELGEAPAQCGLQQKAHLWAERARVAAYARRHALRTPVTVTKTRLQPAHKIAL